MAGRKKGEQIALPTTKERRDVKGRFARIKSGKCPVFSCDEKLVIEGDYWVCPVHRERLANAEIFNQDNDEKIWEKLRI